TESAARRAERSDDVLAVLGPIDALHGLRTLRPLCLPAPGHLALDEVRSQAHDHAHQSLIAEDAGEDVGLALVLAGDVPKRLRVVLLRPLQQPGQVLRRHLLWVQRLYPGPTRDRPGAQPL